MPDTTPSPHRLTAQRPYANYYTIACALCHRSRPRRPPSSYQVLRYYSPPYAQHYAAAHHNASQSTPKAHHHNPPPPLHSVITPSPVLLCISPSPGVCAQSTNPPLVAPPSVLLALSTPLLPTTPPPSLRIPITTLSLTG
jgi:hypothetical protein